MAVWKTPSTDRLPDKMTINPNVPQICKPTQTDR